MITFKIIDNTTGRKIVEVKAKTGRGAVRVFRNTFMMEHNYPSVVAVR